jgi:hypothetical protein
MPFEAGHQPNTAADEHGEEQNQKKPAARNKAFLGSTELECAHDEMGKGVNVE